MQDCNTKGLYVQGIYSFEFYDIADDALLFQSRYISEANITTSTNLNAIKGGIGNATLIQIPSDAELKVAMTAQNFTLDGLSLNTGAQIMPEATYRVQETVTLGEGGVGKVPAEPVSAEGSRTGDIVGYVNCATKVVIDPDTREFTVPEGKAGDIVCIAYFTRNANAEMFTIGSNFSPKVGRAILRTPIYSSDGIGNSNEGIKVGELQIVIPRAQLDGNLNINLSQTSNATTVLNMTALVDYSVKTGECPNDDGVLGHIIQVLYTDSIWDSIDKLVVVDCGVTVEEGETAKLVVKGYDTTTESLVNIPYEDLRFVSNDENVATVNAKGVVTGVAEGVTTVTIKLVLEDKDKDGNVINTTVLLTKDADVTVVPQRGITQLELVSATTLDITEMEESDNEGIRENANNYSVTKSGNTITVTDNGLIPYVGGNIAEPKKWVGILVDLKNRATGTVYTIEDIDYADAARWGATTNTTFVMWLTTEQGGTYTFTNVEDETDTIDITVEFTE